MQHERSRDRGIAQVPTLEALSALPVAASHNRLRIGRFQLAFGEHVLLIESSATTILYSDIEARDLRMLASTTHVYLELLRRPAVTLSLTATPRERDSAMAYFRERNVVTQVL